jgi:Tfp pilus assembly protein PilN
VLAHLSSILLLYCIVGVAAVTSFVTSKVYDHHLHQAQQRYMALRRDHEQVQEQLAQVDAQWRDLDLRK